MTPYYEHDGITIYHGDCREILPELPKVDLVLTDPPYGIDENSSKQASRQGHGIANQRDYGSYSWDKKPISQDLYELCRGKGRYACIWGGIYYENPPSPSWLVWDKQNGGNDFKAIGIEIEEKYCEMAVKRLAQEVLF